MPLLAGGLVADASGDQIVDASANRVGEPAVQVVVGASGVLFDALQAGGVREVAMAIPWTQIAEILGPIIADAIAAALLGEDEELLTTMAGQVEDIDLRTEKWEPPSGLHYQTLVYDVGQLINGIPASGGLTEEEHNHLVGLANLGASDVWDYQLQFPTPANWYADLPMWSLMSYAAQAGFFQSLISGQPLPSSRWFRLAGAPERIAGLLDDARTSQPQLVLPAQPDFSQVQEGDTVLSFLLRTQPAFDWQVLTGHHYWDGGAIGYPADSGGNVCWVICLLRASDLVVQQAASLVTSEGFLPDPVTVAPVWPGLANVTMGDPVALDTGVTITEPMDGILITITGVDPHKVWYTYDSQKAYRHVGSLAFVTDNGALEQYQIVAFESGLYTPLHIERAAGVIIRTAGGTVGTATPWTRTEA